MWRALVAALLVATVGCGALPQNLPPYLHPCNRNLPQAELNSCIAGAITDFIRSMRDAGSVELELPPLDPMTVPHLELQQGSGKVGANLTFSGVHFKGLSNTEVNSARVNLADLKLEVSLKAEAYEVDGDYACTGGVYELPLESSGQFGLSMTDVTSTWFVYLTTYESANQTFLAASRFMVDISPINVAYRFDRQFDGDNSLGSAMDEFMNENSMEIYNDVKPQLMKIMGSIFLNIANLVLKKFPYDTLLPA